MEDGPALASMPSYGPRKSCVSVPGRSCSRRWIATAPKRLRPALTSTITEAVDVPVIASGGVGALEHLVEGVTEGGADAVLAASIFHFGEHTVGEAKALMLEAGVTVRPTGA